MHTKRWSSKRISKKDVNPIDASITAYYALDMVDKTVFPDLGTLLMEKCPHLYDNYQRLLNDPDDKSAELMSLRQNKVGLLPKKYYDTDIYRVSREIKKMQKLNSNILSTWYENSDAQRMCAKLTD